MSRLTPHAHNLRTHPYVVELPVRPGGLGQSYDRAMEWLTATYGGPSKDGWRVLGLSVYFADEADAEAFAEAWPGILRSGGAQSVRALAHATWRPYRWHDGGG